MADLILPSATAALAHKRLRESAERLRDKITAARYDIVGRTATRPVTVQPTDRRMLALLDAARDLLAGHRRPDLPPGMRIGTGPGTFAVLGTTGYDWPTYAEAAAEQPIWRSGAMRRGSPDPQFGRVTVPTAEFALQVALHTLPNVTSADDAADVRAFTGGMLARAAHDAIVAPVARGLRADVNTRVHDRLGPAAMGVAADRARRSVLGDRRGSSTWERWWPDVDEVPDALWDGYISALEATYGLSGTQPGFASFLERFEAGEPIDRESLEAGVRYLTGGRVLEDWGLGMWYLVLTPALLSVPISLLVGRALPPADGFLAPGGSANALGGLQIFSLAHGISAITPFALSMHLWTLVPGHQVAFVSNLVTGILRFVLTPATMGAAAAGSAGATWPLWALQTGTDLYSLISGIVAFAQSRSADGFLHMINTLPSVMGLTATGFAAIFEAAGLTDDLGYWLTWAILTVLIMVAGGLGAAAGLAGAEGIGALFDPDRDPRLSIVEALESLAGADAATLAAVFDDSTLWRDTTAATSTAATLDELRYPPDAKPIVRVWWEGTGDLEIAHDDHTIQLRVDGGAPTVIVLRPDQLDPASLAIRLEDELTGVSTALVDPDLPLSLAFPAALADPGDDAATVAEHDELADDFLPVGTTEEDAYVLRCGPRALVASRVSAGSDPLRRTGPLAIAPNDALGDLDASALGLAGDLAAMLCAGAAPVLGPVTANTAGLPPIADPVPPAVYQVFRQWNLDERRLNEWREIVTGGAAPDTADAAGHHAGLRPHPNPATYNNVAAAAGADLVADMGWIPTWRAWLRMATDITTDSAAATAEPYTPQVQRRDGTTAAPTNQQLTDAMRFLFDLP